MTTIVRTLMCVEMLSDEVATVLGDYAITTNDNVQMVPKSFDDMHKVTIFGDKNAQKYLCNKIKYLHVHAVCVGFVSMRQNGV